MEEYPKCSKCLDIFGNNNNHSKAPKVLTCGDSFCKACLETLIKECDEEYFLCPICKERIKKERNIDSYITSKEIIRLVKAHFNIPQEEINNLGEHQIIKYDIILLGNMNVGKTCIFRRLLKDEYEEKNFPTINLDLEKYYIKYKNRIYKLLVHDTSGKEKYESITKNYLTNKDGVLFIYDVSEPKSFDNLNYWYNLYKEQNEKVIGLLIGNKCDLESKVDEENAKDFADIHGLKYIETSAKSDKNIKKASAFILEEIIKSKSPILPNINHLIEIDNISSSNHNRNGKKCSC